MKIDRRHFTAFFLGPKKNALNKLIDSGKRGCRFALTADASKKAILWAQRWRVAVCHLRQINAVQVFVAKSETIEDVIKEFKQRVAKAKDDEIKESTEFALKMLKDYKEEHDK